MTECLNKNNNGFLSGKESACQAGNAGLISGLGRSPGEGDGNPLQYSRLESPINRGAWRATVTKNQTLLSNKENNKYIYIYIYKIINSVNI